MPGGSVRFRIWAPGLDALRLDVDGQCYRMDRAGDGWFEKLIADLPVGSPYCFVLDDGRNMPDPASRRQETDVHGRSIVCSGSYEWRHTEWVGRPWEETVIYELHVGTFTDEGTFEAAMAKLPLLAEIGITAIEIMPVAQFGGNRGWGYDGTLLYAPHTAYGKPDDLKAFIDAAHGHEIMVFLDVVYNHFGPDGNYLPVFAPDFFDKSRDTPWGPAINFAKKPVRHYFIDNALYWLGEFRFDGLRFDAIDHIVDTTDPEILVEVAQQIRCQFPHRHIHLTTEDNRNITRLHHREGGKAVLHTAEWNDDFHSVAHVIATGETEGHFSDFKDQRWDKLATALTEGFVYQGQPSQYLSGKRRGEPSSALPFSAFVDFLQNHDQIGNRAFGERLAVLAEDRLLHTLTAILFLSPHIPLFFMGQDWGETRPFCFFTDFHGTLADLVRDGRRREFSSFSAFSEGNCDIENVPDPNDENTFAMCKLDWAKPSSPEGRDWRAYFHRLIALRRRYLVPLLASGGAGVGRRIQVEQAAIAIDWSFDVNRTLSLRANLGASAANVVKAPCQPFFAYPHTDTRAEQGMMVPVSVEVALT
nr:malto-oligosyltrehalose trehalohydrolase [Phyllobacterium ifriqiyense]